MLRLLSLWTVFCLGIPPKVSSSYAAILLPANFASVTVVDPSLGHLTTSLPAENVYELGFSPRGTFIITWQRPSKDDNGDAVKNLKVWRVLEEERLPSGEDERNVVGRFVQKSQTGWNLQYTFDERYCARVVTNEIQFYESGDLGTVWNKLRVEGVSDFAISPGENYSIAVFVPERKVGPYVPLRMKGQTDCGLRVNQRLSRFSMCHNSKVQSLRRTSSKATRSSSSGTLRAQASLFLPKPRLISLGRATMAKRPFTSSVLTEDLIPG